MVYPENLQVPEGMTAEEYVVDAINRATALLAHSLKFGNYEVDDIKQEAALFALKVLSSGQYDPKRKLVNFLYTHIRNRLINLKRDKYKRNDPPCKSCHASIPGETNHPDKQYCSRYRSWVERNVVKHNLMFPMDLSNINDEQEKNTRLEPTVVEDVMTKEILEIIDRCLDVEMREDYLRMRAGVVIPKERRQQIEKAVLEIIEDGD